MKLLRWRANQTLGNDVRAARIGSDGRLNEKAWAELAKGTSLINRFLPTTANLWTYLNAAERKASIGHSFEYTGIETGRQSMTSMAHWGRSFAIHW